MQKKSGETSYKETSFGIISRTKLIPLEIEGIKKAWDFIFQKSKTGKISLTSTFLKKIHKIGFGWIFPKMGGRFRKIEVMVSGHIPPKFYLVPQLMEDFTRDLKIRLKYLPEINDVKFIHALVELLAWAHHRFLLIHPFVDYNGRIGRLLINIILLKLNLPPIELKVETKIGRQKYVKALHEADCGDNSELRKVNPAPRTYVRGFGAISLRELCTWPYGHGFLVLDSLRAHSASANERVLRVPRVSLSNNPVSS